MIGNEEIINNRRVRRENSFQGTGSGLRILCREEQGNSVVI